MQTAGAPRETVDIIEGEKQSLNFLNKSLDMDGEMAVYYIGEKRYGKRP